MDNTWFASTLAWGGEIVTCNAGLTMAVPDGNEFVVSGVEAESFSCISKVYEPGDIPVDVMHDTVSELDAVPCGVAHCVDVARM
jgi:hypothetical protein